MTKPSPEDVLRLAKEAAHGGNFATSTHARNRMDERRVSVSDVMQAVKSATYAEHQRDNKDRDSWKLLGGKDIDGDGLTVVISMDDLRRLRVITVY